MYIERWVRLGNCPLLLTRSSDSHSVQGMEGLSHTEVRKVDHEMREQACHLYVLSHHSTPRAGVHSTQEVKQHSSELLTVTVALKSCICSTAGRYRVQLPLWKSRRAISIQNIARQFLARKKVAGIHHEHLEGVKLQKVRDTILSNRFFYMWERGRRSFV